MNHPVLNAKFVGDTNRFGGNKWTVDILFQSGPVVRRYVPATLSDGFAYFNVNDEIVRIPADFLTHKPERMAAL
jgi:hypothetical protein